MLRKILHRVILTAVLVAGAAFSASAQTTGTYTPYSIYGVGDLAQPGSAYSKTMGGTGVALRNNRYLNLINPAAVTARDTLAFMADFSLYNDNKVFRQAGIRSASNTFNINDLAMSFPIWRKSAMMVGIMPFSDTGFGYSFNYTDPDLIGRTGKPFYAHNSETRSEVAECIERHGLTPTALFEEFGLFENGGGGFHCVHMTEADLEIFSRRGLWVVNCPGSNAKLASGVAPITEMQSLGINLALGTDGPASNNALNMFREMYLAIVLQKLQFRDAAVGDAAEVLRMACSGGAGAMGLEADCLAPGRLADLVVIDLDQPNMYPVHNTVKNLVYSGSNTNVRLTMVGGKVLYENGEFFVGDKPEEIYRRAQISADRLTKD